MSFTIGGQQGWQFAEGSVDSVRGIPVVGFFRVAFDVRLYLPPHQTLEGAHLSALAGEVLIDGRPLGRLISAPHSLPLPAGSGVRTVVLELDIDRARLEALEDIRNGRDLGFIFNLHALLDEPNSGKRTVSVQEVFEVNQGVWVRVLDQMQYRRTLLLEVPVAATSEAPELQSAVVFLAKAQQAMNRGEYREVVGICRDVMDEMSQALNDNSGHGAELRAFFANSRAWDKARRVAMMRRSFTVFTHAARHSDEVSATFEWSRVDAMSAITIASALLNELDAPGAR